MTLDPLVASFFTPSMMIPVGATVLKNIGPVVNYIKDAWVSPNKRLIKLIFSDKNVYVTSGYISKEEKNDWKKSKNIVSGRPQKIYHDIIEWINVLKIPDEYKRHICMPAPYSLLEIMCAYMSLFPMEEPNWKIAPVVQQVNEEERVRQNFTVLLGSPISNRFSYELINRDPSIPVEFSFDSPEHEIIKKVGFEKAYVPKYDSQKEYYPIDYSLIIHKRGTRNAFGKGVLGIMGCHAYGTVASTRILTNPGEIKGAKMVIKNILKYYDRNFFMVLKIKTNEDGKFTSISLADKITLF